MYAYCFRYWNLLHLSRSDIVHIVGNHHKYTHIIPAGRHNHTCKAMVTPFAEMSVRQCSLHNPVPWIKRGASYIFCEISLFSFRGLQPQQSRFSLGLRALLWWGAGSCCFLLRLHDSFSFTAFLLLAPDTRVLTVLIYVQPILECLNLFTQRLLP